MSPARSNSPTHDRVRPAMAAGLAVSVLAHLGAIWLVGRVQAAGPDHALQQLPPIVPDAADREDPPLRLGMDIPENASIAWLGVLENPVEAEAPESEVDQAALVPVVGAQLSQPSEPQPPVEAQDPTPATEETPPEPVPEPAQAEPTDPVVPDQPIPDPGTPMPFPIETTPAEAEADLPPETEPTEPQLSTEAAPLMGPPPPPEPRPQPEATPAAPTPAREPAQEGAPGVQDQRAADAAKRRAAKDLRTDLLGQPLQASGDLNFKTVRPTWSLQVRNAYNPRRNPVVEIHFGPDGRVALAEFVPQPDGTRGSGYEEVDQPLLNAVYRWTASGKAIDALDKQDPKARVSVVIRFLLSSGPPGD